MAEPDNQQLLVQFGEDTLKAAADGWLAGEYGIPGTRDFTAMPWKMRSYGPSSGTWEYRYTGGQFIEATPAKLGDWKPVIDIEADGKKPGTFHTNWLYTRWHGWEREWMRRIGITERYGANVDLMRDESRRWGGYAGQDLQMGSDRIEVLWQYFPFTTTRTDEFGIQWAFKYSGPYMYAYSPTTGNGYPIRLTDEERANASRERLEARIDRWLGNQLGELVDRLKNEHEDLTLHVDLPGDGKTLVINLIKLPSRGQRLGVGTAVMRALTRHADERGYRMAATPTPEFGSSRAGVARFVERFGFEKTKREGFDAPKWTMTRAPQKKET
ncbi:hypothetical protein [Kitasatospora sp. NPDC098663]|uniref:hypothetical protein n=1 Tax=Kitasatospora sp. NPDC098663 TaxID=3364096 RepID=UPI003814CE94